MTAWQRQLGLVDAALSTWQDVQKLWQALESIYVGSEDIRKQLPEDSQRFNTINGLFKVPTCFTLNNSTAPSLLDQAAVLAKDCLYPCTD